MSSTGGIRGDRSRPESARGAVLPVAFTGAGDGAGNRTKARIDVLLAVIALILVGATKED